MIEEETVYVYLLEEGTDVWRPVRAVRVQDNWHRIVSVNSDPDAEKWQFTTGDIVRCEMRSLSEGEKYREVLVAVEKKGSGT